MTTENKKTHIATEIDRSDQSLRAARVLLGAGLLYDAESRLYYAIYHAAVALLLTEGIVPRPHSGVMNLLGLHFVRAGRLDAGDGRLFARIQKCRLEADYGRGFALTEAGLREDLAACEGFLERARDEIRGTGLF